MRRPDPAGIDRRALLSGLVLGVLVSPFAVEAQQADRIYRIGYLGLEPQTPDVYEPFRQGLRDLGYVVEGR